MNWGFGFFCRCIPFFHFDSVCSLLSVATKVSSHALFEYKT